MKPLNIKETAVGRSDLFRLKPEDIHILDGWNSREAEDPANAEHVESLALSIAENGVKQPLKVFQQEGKFYVSDGHCRLAAVRIAIGRGAEIRSVPVIPEDKTSSPADRIFSQILLNSGKPLAPLEQARVFQRLLAFGWTLDEIAARAGKGKAYITGLLELHAAPADVTEPVKKGEVSASLAKATLKKHGAGAGAVIKKAVETAKASGKAKATPKHIEKPAESQSEAFDSAIAAFTAAAPVGADLSSFKAGWDAAMAAK